MFCSFQCRKRNWIICYSYGVISNRMLKTVTNRLYFTFGAILFQGQFFGSSFVILWAKIFKLGRINSIFDALCNGANRFELSVTVMEIALKKLFFSYKKLVFCSNLVTFWVRIIILVPKNAECFALSNAANRIDLSVIVTE